MTGERRACWPQPALIQIEFRTQFLAYIWPPARPAGRESDRLVAKQRLSSVRWQASEQVSANLPLNGLLVAADWRAPRPDWFVMLGEHLLIYLYLAPVAALVVVAAAAAVAAAF